MVSIIYETYADTSKSSYQSMMIDKRISRHFFPNLAAGQSLVMSGATLNDVVSDTSRSMCNQSSGAQQRYGHDYFSRPLWCVTADVVSASITRLMAIACGANPPALIDIPTPTLLLEGSSGLDCKLSLQNT